MEDIRLLITSCIMASGCAVGVYLEGSFHYKLDLGYKDWEPDLTFTYTCLVSLTHLLFMIHLHVSLVSLSSHWDFFSTFFNDSVACFRLLCLLALASLVNV